MYIYKDILGDCEMGSDNYPVEVVDDLYYKFKCEMVDADDSEVEVNTGANASAEAEEGGDGETGTEQVTQTPADEPKAKIIDFVKNHRLQPTTFSKKSEYQLFMKGYLAELKEKIDEDKFNALKTALPSKMKEHILDHFKECQFFIGEDYAGGVAICREINNVPYMFVLKEAVVGEKY